MTAVAPPVVVPSWAPPRDAILTPEQLAAWLQVSVDQAKGLNLPAIRVGKRGWRFVAGQVVDELQRRAG